MYFCLVLPFIKNKRVYHSICMFLISYNLLGGFISFLEPSGLIHEYISLTAHAFLCHMSLVFLGCMIGLNQNIKKEKKDFIGSFKLFLCLCVVAFIINLIFYKVSRGDINMFYVGPRISPIIVFTSIATKYGWFINDIVYIFAMTLGSFLIYLPFTNKNLTKM